MKELTPEDVIKYQQCEFETGAYGPNKFDCYGLVHHVNKHFFDTELPRFDDVGYTIERLNAFIEGQALGKDWERVEHAGQGDAVVMRRAGESYHVGVFILPTPKARGCYTLRRGMAFYAAI